MTDNRRRGGGPRPDGTTGRTEGGSEARREWLRRIVRRSADPGDWLTDRAAELLLAGGRVRPPDAEAAAVADRLAHLLAAAGRHPSADDPAARDSAVVDPKREEAALAAFRAARCPEGAADVVGVPAQGSGRSAAVRLPAGPHGFAGPRPAVRSLRVAAAALATVLAVGGVAFAVAAGTGRLPLPGGGSGAPGVSSTPSVVAPGGSGEAPTGTVSGPPHSHRSTPAPGGGPAVPCVTHFSENGNDGHGQWRPGAICVTPGSHGDTGGLFTSGGGNGRSGDNSGSGGDHSDKNSTYSDTGGASAGGSGDGHHKSGAKASGKGSYSGSFSGSDKGSGSGNGGGGGGNGGGRSGKGGKSAKSVNSSLHADQLIGRTAQPLKSLKPLKPLKSEK